MIVGSHLELATAARRELEAPREREHGALDGEARIAVEAGDLAAQPVDRLHAREARIEDALRARWPEGTFVIHVEPEEEAHGPTS